MQRTLSLNLQKQGQMNSSADSRQNANNLNSASNPIIIEGTQAQSAMNQPQAQKPNLVVQQKCVPASSFSRKFTSPLKGNSAQSADQKSPPATLEVKSHEAVAQGNIIFILDLQTAAVCCCFINKNLTQFV